MTFYVVTQACRCRWAWLKPWERDGLRHPDPKCPHHLDWFLRTMRTLERPEDS